jgi:hypothetical protein
MKTLYWAVEIMKPVNSDSDRCIMLHGKCGEVVGPLTFELAEQWMERFDGSNLSPPGPLVRTNPNKAAANASY